MNDGAKPGNDAGRVLGNSVFPFCFRLRKATGEEGASPVEYALSATIFFTFVPGIMGSSIVAYSYLFVPNAAREASRYAIVRGDNFGTDCSSVGPAKCVVQPSDIGSYVKGLAFPGININNLNISSNWLTSTGVSCGSGDSCKVPSNQKWVQVSYTYGLKMPLIPKQKFTLASSSQMVIAQ